MPAVLVEVEFLSNPDQLRFLADENNRQIIERAISNGIEKFITFL